MFIHVGKIFDLNYKPYFMGKELELDEDNIFHISTTDENASIEIRE